MKLTLKQIADKAGVSLATVSLVINGKPAVSAVTKNKVLKIINEFGYTAKLSKGTSTNTIRFLKFKKHGLVVDENGFISSLIDGVSIGARKHGYDVVITTVTRDNQDSVIQQVKSDPREGIVLLGTELETGDLAFLHDLSVPIVIVDSYFEYEDYDCVVMNNKDASYKAVQYLYEKGFREIGHFESSVMIHNFAERKSGYLQALKNFKLPYHEQYIYRLEPTMEGAYRDMKQILKNDAPLPQAIFSDNDTIAVGAIKALKEYNIKIPDELSIIGFDDIPFCTMISPTLTTMRILKEEIGSMAAGRLIEKIENKDTSIIKTRIGAELVERESIKF